MRVKFPLAVLLILLLAAAAYSGWWFYSARLLRTAIESWIADQRSAGASVDYRSLDIGGFPLWTTVTVRDGATAFPNGIEWRGPVLEARTRPWNWTTVLFEARGVHRAVFPAPDPSARTAATSQAGFGELRLTYGGEPMGARGALHEVSIGPGPDPSPATAMSLGLIEFAADRPVAPPRDYRDPGLTLSSSIQQIRLPDAVKAPLGSTVERLALAGSVMGPLPIPVGQQSLAAWRDAGGIVELKNLGLAWGAVAATVEGTVALDRQLQPQAALTGKIVGFMQAIDALLATGQMRPNAASLAKAAMGLLARKEKPDGPAVLTTPITLQDRTIFLGPVKLIQFPRIEWP